MATGPTIDKGVQIAVFAKAPIPGLAKTRLSPALGAVGAARLQRCLTLRALGAAHAAAVGPVSLWCAPDTEHRFFRALRRRYAIRCYRQPEGDLGKRMSGCFERLLGSAAVLLIGTDCPAITPERLRAAASALDHSDAFLYPAADGGYVLIGLRRLVPLLFEAIHWGTERVTADTRKRLAALGWSWDEGETLHDIDEVEDLIHLPAELIQTQRPPASSV
jgi:rSAM/selenodomain-associated transferase 1